MKTLSKTDITIDRAVEMKEAILEGVAGLVSFNYIPELYENMFNEAITFEEQIMLAAYLIKKGVHIQNS